MTETSLTETSLTETVLITGASSGIGLELARCFASEGSCLVLVARRRDKLEELARELQSQHNVEVTVLVRDLAEPNAVVALYEELAARTITVDVVVNNAGFGGVGEVAQLPVQRQLDMVQVNVMTVVQLTRLLLPGMLQRERGGVLNVASTAAFQAGPKMAVYYASKAFVLSFTEALAEEVSDTELKVSCLCPGPTSTGFGEDSGMDDLLLFKLGTATAASVARYGHRAFRRGKLIAIPGWLNKLGAFSVRFVPRSLVRKIVKRLQS